MNKFVLFTTWVSGVVVPLDSFIDKRLSKDTQFQRIDEVFASADDAEAWHWRKFGTAAFVLSGDAPQNEERISNRYGDVRYRQRVVT